VPQDFEEIEHTADRAFRAYGRDLRELFLNAARAVLAMEGATEGAAPTTARDVRVEGIDRETLLVNWLNELLYLQERHGESYSGIRIAELSERRLAATLAGATASTRRRKIKAVTFHGLQVTQGDEGWQATIVVDV
jgi:SHS2 domain-containing protein